MTIPEFIAKWRKVELKERSAAQEHFIDLCNALNHPTPATDDPTGANFCFEKGAAKHGGGDGFADVWKRGFFGWEYKGKHKDLVAAYDQLLRYRDALGSPPLLVVCDLDRIVVHTNFTGTVSVPYEMSLESLAEPRNIEILRAVFNSPEELRPGLTITAVTQDAARHFAEIAAAMRQRGLDPAAVAHFLDRVVFCLFAEDTCYLPNRVFAHIVEKSSDDPARFSKMLGQLFDAMATGGDFGVDSIHHFNGNLFDDRTVLDLTADEIKRIATAAKLDWRAVDPSIFGTLFERGLDPSKRAQLGAHFTSREDIELVVDAVIMAVLRREWDECRQTIDNLLATGKKISPGGTGVPPASKATAKPLTAAAMKKAAGEAESTLRKFLDRLQHVRILDPACGSGNFLYVALLRLKDLEKEVILFGSDNGFGASLYLVGPLQLYGIEVNSYAHDLAQMTVWIGWLQWIRDNGVGFPADPILRSLSDNIRRMDAIVAENGEPDWPVVDFIVGNPPFLGGKKLRRELGDAYVDRIFTVWRDRVPAEADLCCYWFEKARAHIAAGKCKRAGLLSTQRIRTGANRDLLRRIIESGGIFWAQSDRPWILDGANVNVSMIGFDDGSDKTRTLDGRVVSAINANLTAAADLTQARRIKANSGISFMGDTKGGPFDIPETLAREWLPLRNPNGKPNSDVLRPWANGLEITRQPQRLWIVDFGVDTPEEEASRYEAPFEYLRAHAKAARAGSRSKINRWWLHERPREDMRLALAPLKRCIATPCVSKHRVFVWLDAGILPDHQLIVFARDDDFFFGLLHSHVHRVWALATCGRLETRPQYTPTTSFETFPLPQATPEQRDVIAVVARELDAARCNWLGDRSDPKRTLTQLYNDHPAWLTACHAKLDAAVADAYGWPADLADEVILERLLALNQGATGSSPTMI